MSVQLENGFTKIANELFEQMPFYKFNGSQFSVIITIIRFTYGFNRKDHDISLTFLTNATGIKRTQVERELSSLIVGKVIIVTKESTKTTARKLGLNKHYEEWLIERRYPLIRGQSPKKSIPELEDTESPNQRIEGIPYLEDKEIKSFKEIFKDSSSSGKSANEIEIHFCTKRGKGWQVSPEDYKEITAAIDYGIPTEFIKSSIDRGFSEFKPKHQKDEIRSITYCIPRIYDEWHNHLEKAKGVDSGEKYKGHAKGFRYGSHQSQSGSLTFSDAEQDELFAASAAYMSNV